MALYLVILPDDPAVPGDHPAQERIKKDFPTHIEAIAGRAWFVQADVDTCGEVANVLQFGQPPHDTHSGLVIRVTDCDGYHYSSFWDRLDSMKKADTQ